MSPVALGRGNAYATLLYGSGARAPPRCDGAHLLGGKPKRKAANLGVTLTSSHKICVCVCVLGLSLVMPVMLGVVGDCGFDAFGRV